MNHQDTLNFCSTYFTQTGSRFFNRLAPDIVVVHDNTDYDFVAYDGMPFLDEFEKLPGVRRVGDQNLNSTYPINRFVAYWLMYDEPSGFDLAYAKQKLPQIQVIVRPTQEIYRAYRDVFNNITPEFYRDYLWKSAPGNPIPKSVVAERMDILMDCQILINRA